ncbi:MAG: hypothetical protein ACREBC_25115 [Pyrinomonadaceae bacterium]
MLTTIKSHLDDFLVLPNAVKGVIYTVLLVLIATAVFFAGSNYWNGKKIEKLHKKNAQLSQASAESLQKMKAAEVAAAEQRERADNLENDIKNLEFETQKQDEKIIVVKKASTDIRTRLIAVRAAEPKRADADELTRRLKARYGSPGQTGNAGSGK